MVSSVIVLLVTLALLAVLAIVIGVHVALHPRRRQGWTPSTYDGPRTGPSAITAVTSVLGIDY